MCRGVAVVARTGRPRARRDARRGPRSSLGKRRLVMTTTPSLSAPAPVLRLHPEDTVGIARADLAPGALVELGGLTPFSVRSAVPRGHKIALMDVAQGGQVRKYGQLIGQATSDIAAGDHVHTHNLGMAEIERDYAFGTEAVQPEVLPLEQQATFHG